MAFAIKEWKNRIVEFAGRRKLTNITSGNQDVVDVVRAEGAVSQEGDTFSAENMNDLEQRISNAFIEVDSDLDELKNSVSDGKTLVANAITGKGVTTATDATFSTMASNIAAIEIGEFLDDYTGTTVDAGSTSSDSSYVYLTPPAEGKYDGTSKIRTTKSNTTPTFTTQSKSVTFTANSNGYTTQTVNFSFANKVLGIRGLKCSPYTNNLNFPLWDGNYVAISFGTNSISIPLRGVTSGTSYTITVDAIGY